MSCAHGCSHAHHEQKVTPSVDMIDDDDNPQKKPDLLITGPDGKKMVNPKAIEYMIARKKDGTLNPTQEQRDYAKMMTEKYERIRTIFETGDDATFTRDDLDVLLLFITDCKQGIADDFFEGKFPNSAQSMSASLTDADWLPHKDKFNYLKASFVQLGLFCIAHAYWTRHFAAGEGRTFQLFDEKVWTIKMAKLLEITPGALQYMVNIGRMHFVQFPNKKHYLEAVPMLTAIKDAIPVVKAKSPEQILAEGGKPQLFDKTDAQKVRAAKKKAQYQEKLKQRKEEKRPTTTTTTTSIPSDDDVKMAERIADFQDTLNAVKASGFYDKMSPEDRAEFDVAMEVMSGPL